MKTAIGNFIVTTRKSHTCDGCGRTFDKGTEMEKISVKDTETNEFSTSYLCPTCQIVIRDNFPETGEYTIGEFYDLAINYEKSVFGQAVETEKVIENE